MLEGALLLIAYLVGAIPTAYLITKAVKGVDIRALGSGNPGATNVFRSVGRGAGIITLIADMAKGYAPVWLAQRYFAGMWVPVAAGLAAVIGHTWPVFLRFKGGKGVATSAGVFLALLPFSTVLALLAFAVGFGISKHVSIGSLCGAIVLPGAAFWRHGPSPEAWLAVALALLILFRHVPNIKRLARGEELGVARKKESA